MLMVEVERCPILLLLMIKVHQLVQIHSLEQDIHLQDGKLPRFLVYIHYIPIIKKVVHKVINKMWINKGAIFNFFNI